MPEYDVHIADGGTGLDVDTGNGHRRTIAAALLWAECPSAQGRMRRLHGGHRSPPHDLAIRSISEIGAYGINIAFTDGHDRGIYPWAFLASLASKPTIADFLED